MTHHIDKRMDKNHMIISIDAEKALVSIQPPLMIKTLNKVGFEGTNLNIIKVIHEKPTANMILNGEKQSFPSTVRNKTGMSTLLTFIQHSTESPSHNNQTTKRNERHLNQQRRSKTFTFCNDMIPYIENLKNSTKKLLELMKEFSKATKYKINVQKSVVLLYNSNEAAER